MDLATARTRIADAPCVGYPVELASRTYDARIMEVAAGRRLVTLADSTGRSQLVFEMFLAGDRVVFDVGDDGIDEDLPESRFLTVWTGAVPSDPSQLTLGSSTSMPVTGEFRYCHLKSGRGIYNDCSQLPHDQILDYHSCTSDRIVMTFTKR